MPLVAGIAPEDIASSASRIADALERLATAQERAAAVDPMALLNDALLAQDAPDGAQMDQTTAAAFASLQAPQVPQHAWKGTGYTKLYAHPDNPKLVIVARKDADAPGGWTVAVEDL